MQFDERRYRPLSAVDLFDEAFDLYKRNFVLFLSIVAIVIVPSTIFSDIYALKMVNALTARITVGASDPTTAFATLGDFAKQGVSQFILFYIAMLVPWTLSYLALTSAVSARYLGKTASLATAYVAGYRKLFAGIVAAFVFTLTLNAGGVIAAFGVLYPDLAPAFVVVGVIVELFTGLVILAKYPLFMGAILNENLGPFKALKRSSTLTQHDSGRIVWIFMCLSVLFMVVYVAVEGVLELLTGGIVQSSILVIPVLQNNRIVAGQIADGLAAMLINPFMMIIVTLVYFDQRVRKEGYDMEVLASRLGYPDVVVGATTAYAPALAELPIKVRGKKR